MRSTAAERQPLFSAAASDTGLRRENNEDRFHCDPPAGLYMVIDGVGGQAAGEKAAETALSMLRARLERETGAPAERLREAITLANNEVHRLSQLEPDWQGMACVLTAALVRDGRLVAGHVGDTRLYVFESGRVQKLTHDHSPVGEREDAGELGEMEAMRHPRRNEIFRDVGSEPHSPTDGDFVEIVDRPFRDDSALLICSDGLSDMVTSSEVAGIVYSNAGSPDEVVARLVEAANREGGKDNVTVVFAAGPRFAEKARAHAGALHEPSAPLDRAATGKAGPVKGAGPRRVLVPRWLAAAAGLVAGCGLGLGLAFLAVTRFDGPGEWVLQAKRPAGWTRTWTVGFEPGADFTSIADAMAQASPGDTIRVAPGEYRAPIDLRPGIRLVSVKRHEAIIRPALGGEPSAAVVIRAGLRSVLAGFRISGDADRPLAVGVRVNGTQAEIDDVEITATTQAAVLFEERAGGVLRGSAIHDNHGPGVVVRPHAAPALRHNVITANGKQAGSPRPGVEMQEFAHPVLTGNIIVGNGEDHVAGLPAGSRVEVLRDNIIGLPAPPPTPGRRSGIVRDPEP
jgi:serine/threonine protein phosphatase PrpC